MPKRALRVREGTPEITTYADLREQIATFASSKLGLLLVVGAPGLGKSRHIETAIEGTRAYHCKGGRVSAVMAYVGLFYHVDEPVVIDDADNLMAQRDGLQLIKQLTETDPKRLLTWNTASRVLDEHEVPRSFWTTSPCAIYANSWDSEDTVCEAIESRAHFYHFVPSWEEVLKDAARWYWDQEIIDYVCKRADCLRRPDVRLLVKAAEIKAADMKIRTWQRFIDDYIDDEVGMYVRLLLDDPKHPSNNERADKFAEDGMGHRSTFYRRMKEIRTFRPTSKIGPFKCEGAPPASKVQAKPVAVGLEVAEDAFVILPMVPKQPSEVPPVASSHASQRERTLKGGGFDGAALAPYASVGLQSYGSMSIPVAPAQVEGHDWDGTNTPAHPQQEPSEVPPVAVSHASQKKAAPKKKASKATPKNTKKG